MSDSRLTISVVIPAFEAEPFLAESIESVLAQELAPSEVVVVDDGSTDATAAIAEGFGDAVQVVHQGQHCGVAAARNVGLAHTTGTAISMHDADDRMLPHRLRVEAEHLSAGGPDLGCVLGRARSFADDGRTLPPWAYVDGTSSSYGTSLVLAWRTTYDRVGGYDESFTVGEDSDWLLRVRFAGLTVELIDADLTERRWHDGNLSTAQGPPDRHELARSVRKLIERRRAAP